MHVTGKSIVNLSLFLWLGVSVLSEANGTTPRIDARQTMQEQRINAGMASGSITPREAYRLQTQQNRTEQIEANAKADGKVSRAERAQLARRLNQSNRNIFRKKHNRYR